MVDESDDPKNGKDKKPIIRNKDNAVPHFKPNFSRHPAPNIAPYGMSGIHQGSEVKQDHTEQVAKPEPVSILKDHPCPQLLTDGKLNDEMNHSFVLKIDDYRTPNGIEYGKITQLEVQSRGEIVAQFTDRKWIIEPETDAQKQIVQDLQDRFGERPKEYQHSVLAVIDKDFGHEH